MRLIVPSVAILLLTSGCQDAASPLAFPRVQPSLTQADTLSSDPAALAVLRLDVLHVGGRTTALAGCPEPPAFTLERQIDGRWVDDSQRGTVCPAIYSPR